MHICLVRMLLTDIILMIFMALQATMTVKSSSGLIIASMF